MKKFELVRTEACLGGQRWMKAARSWRGQAGRTEAHKRRPREKLSREARSAEQHLRDTLATAAHDGVPHLPPTGSGRYNGDAISATNPSRRRTKRTFSLPPTAHWSPPRRLRLSALVLGLEYRLAAVHHICSAGNKRGLIRSKEHCCRRNLLGTSMPPHRYAGLDPRPPLVVLHYDRD